MGRPRGCVTGDGGTGNASIEARRSRVSTDGTTRDLVGIPADGSAATGRLYPKAILESAESLGAIKGSELGQVGTRQRSNLAIDWVIDPG